jgi:hypothetical protein
MEAGQHEKAQFGGITRAAGNLLHSAFDKTDNFLELGFLTGSQLTKYSRP